MWFQFLVFLVRQRLVIDSSDELELNYAEIVSPLIAAGIIATSLFFVKSVHDKRRIDELLQNDVTKSS